MINGSKIEKSSKMNISIYKSRCFKLLVVCVCRNLAWKFKRREQFSTKRKMSYIIEIFFFSKFDLLNCLLTFSLDEWSAYLTSNRVVAGYIPSTFTILNMD